PAPGGGARRPWRGVRLQRPAGRDGREPATTVRRAGARPPSARDGSGSQRRGGAGGRAGRPEDRTDLPGVRRGTRRGDRGTGAAAPPAAGQLPVAVVRLRILFRRRGPRRLGRGPATD